MELFKKKENKLSAEHEAALKKLEKLFYRAGVTIKGYPYLSADGEVLFPEYHVGIVCPEDGSVVVGVKGGFPEEARRKLAQATNGEVVVFFQVGQLHGEKVEKLPFREEEMQEVYDHVDAVARDGRLAEWDHPLFGRGLFKV